MQLPRSDDVLRDLPLKEALDTLVAATAAPFPLCADEPSVESVGLDRLDPFGSYGSDTTVLAAVLRAGYDLFGIGLEYRSFVPVGGVSLVREEVEGLEEGRFGQVVVAGDSLSSSPPRGVNVPGTEPILYAGSRALMRYLLDEFEPFVDMLSSHHDDLLELKDEYAR